MAYLVDLKLKVLIFLFLELYLCVSPTSFLFASRPYASFRPCLEQLSTSFFKKIPTPLNF